MPNELREGILTHFYEGGQNNSYYYGRKFVSCHKTLGKNNWHMLRQNVKILGFMLEQLAKKAIHLFLQLV